MTNNNHNIGGLFFFLFGVRFINNNDGHVNLCWWQQTKSKLSNALEIKEIDVQELLLSWKNKFYRLMKHTIPESVCYVRNIVTKKISIVNDSLKKLDKQRKMLLGGWVLTVIGTIIWLKWPMERIQSESA